MLKKVCFFSIRFYSASSNISFIGMSIIVADVNDKGGHETVELIQNEVSNSGNDVRAVFVHCDVTSRSDLLKALATCSFVFNITIIIWFINCVPSKDTVWA